MSNHPRTYDGQPLTAGVSGFTEYSTHNENISMVNPPVLSPTDLLTTIQLLKRTLSIPELDRITKVLYAHIHDLDNPHGTDLSQFSDDVCDILYKKFLESGGTGSKAYFIKCLTSALRVASLAEMHEGKDENLLVNIRGAREYFTQHEADANAHEALLKDIFKGSPTTEAPVFALNADIGVSDNIYSLVTDNSEAGKSTYIDADGVLKIQTDVNRHLTYLNGEAYVSCFGPRTNYIAGSNIFTDRDYQYCAPGKTTEVLCPDQIHGCTYLKTKVDTVERVHELIIPDVQLLAGNPRTFSIFAKMESCRFLAISYKDMYEGIVNVYGIYDLEAGTCLTINGMTRYQASITPLVDGWFRCSLSMYHRIGNEADLHVTFFKTKLSDNYFGFKGNAEICGYLYGMQLEDGANPSPYIPTTIKELTRPGDKLTIRLDQEWWDPKEVTFVVQYLNPGIVTDKLFRPLFTITNADGTYACQAKLTNDGRTEIDRYTTLTVGKNSVSTVCYQDLLQYTQESECILVHAINQDKILSRLNSELLEGTAPASWSKGSQFNLGWDPNGTYLNGYVKAVTIYPYKVSDDESAFLVGELHG